MFQFTLIIIHKHYIPSFLALKHYSIIKMFRLLKNFSRAQTFCINIVFYVFFTIAIYMIRCRIRIMRLPTVISKILTYICIRVKSFYMRYVSLKTHIIILNCYTISFPFSYNKRIFTIHSRHFVTFILFQQNFTPTFKSFLTALRFTSIHIFPFSFISASLSLHFCTSKS